jgi:diguanylate cyclase (GGDEF)-like protein/PAS domain S-box-containing protein
MRGAPTRVENMGMSHLACNRVSPRRHLRAVRELAARHLPHGRTLPEAEWQRRHGGILVVLWALAVFLPAYGIARGHALSHDIAGSAMLVATAVVATRLRDRHAVSSALTSYGLCLASALAVHLANGAIEAHFMFFVMIIIVALYEDWRPFLVAFGFVVLHHGLMGFLDRGSVYDHPGNPWLIALVHGGFVAAAGIACVVTWSCNEDVRAESLRAAERARESDARFRSVFEDGPVGMALVGLVEARAGTLLQVNHTLCAQFGYDRGSSIVGADLYELLSSESVPRVLQHIDTLVTGRCTVTHEEVSLLHQDGSSFAGRISMSLVAGADGAGSDLVVQIEDVTERNRLERELQDLADHDPLTGLLNRRRFGRELADRLAAGPGRRSAGAVILIDLDGFKEINDTLGHEAGDQLLVGVAQALRGASRDGDAVARLGGDEFALLINEATAEEADGVGRRILERVHDEAFIGEGARVRRASASVGIVVYASATELTGDQLLNDADLAMYEAKDNGGTRCVVYCADAEAPAGSAAAPSWPDRVRRALDDERFVMYAQPILDLESGAITSFELLLRMLGDDGEVIPPGAFLPVAERRGMIRSIDRWVIGQAVELLEDLGSSEDGGVIAGVPLRLHVNISGRSLSDVDFLGYIATLLEHSHVDPSQLVFEVTETAAIASVDDASVFLTSLSELGCGIALDDFGAGFGSLHYLKNLPVDLLKIDGQFIENLTTDPDDLVVVETLVRMARGLHMRTTAEYVENAATMRLLRDLGVDLAQGYHIGRPAPAREIIRARRTIAAPASSTPSR